MRRLQLLVLALSLAVAPTWARDGQSIGVTAASPGNITGPNPATGCEADVVPRFTDATGRDLDCSDLLVDDTAASETNIRGKSSNNLKVTPDGGLLTVEADLTLGGTAKATVTKTWTDNAGSDTTVYDDGVVRDRFNTRQFGDGVVNGPISLEFDGTSGGVDSFQARLTFQDTIFQASRGWEFTDREDRRRIFMQTPDITFGQSFGFLPDTDLSASSIDHQALGFGTISGSGPFTSQFYLFFRNTAGAGIWDANIPFEGPALRLEDGNAALAAVAGVGQVFVDSADGELKYRRSTGDGGALVDISGGGTDTNCIGFSDPVDISSEAIATTVTSDTFVNLQTFVNSGDLPFSPASVSIRIQIRKSVGSASAETLRIRADDGTEPGVVDVAGRLPTSAAMSIEEHFHANVKSNNNRVVARWSGSFTSNINAWSINQACR